MIPVYKPYLTNSAKKYVTDAIDSTWISSRGKYIDMCTEHLEDMLDARVLLTSNGTCATHLLAKALKFKCPELTGIQVPDGVYVAAINAFLFDKELQLYVNDLDLDTWNSRFREDCAKYQGGLIVHNLGNIINVPELEKKHPYALFVEDNCEGFLGKYNGQYSGTASLASSVSFFGNKNITCGEGGAFITKDDDVYEHIRHISTQGQSKKRFVHDVLGYNYRLTNIQAALLYSQLEILDDIVQMKQSICDQYHSNLSISGVHFQRQEEDTVSSNWMFAVRIENNPGYDLAEKFFNDRGVEIRPMFYPLRRHAHLRNNTSVQFASASARSERNAVQLNKECIVLPSYPELTKLEINHICECVKEYMGEI